MVSGMSAFHPFADMERRIIVVGMLRLWAVAPLAVLTACQSAPPADCKLALKQVHDCFQRFQGANDSRKMLLACLPFSPAEKISGAWVVGFEANSFHEGVKASSDLLRFELTRNPDPHDVRSANYATLVLDPKSGPALPLDGKLRALQVVFIGKREKFPITPPVHNIVVDQVLSTTIRAVAG